MKIKGTVSLEGAEFFARHGVYDFEREKGNTFIIDIFISRIYDSEELYTIDNTFNYVEVHALMHAIMQEPEDLLETVAGKVVKTIINNFSGAETIKFKIRKTAPPIKDSKINYSAFELEWAAGS